MKSQTLARSALVTLAATALLQAQEAAFKPGLTVGTLLNLDVGGVPPADLSTDNLPVDLADAELSIGLKLRPDLSFQTVLVHEDGMATVDQAFATWKSPWLDLAFGKQTLPVGLFPSHLIHDPLVQQDLETIVPSLLASKEQGAFALHLGLASQSREVTEIAEDGSEIPGTATYPDLVAAVDAKWGESGLARLSTRLSHHSRMVSAGATIPAGPLSLDLEGFATDGAWNEADLAALAGLAWKATGNLELAARYDARKAHETGEWTNQAGLGATLKFAEIAYTGAEWMQDLGDGGEGALTLRVGLAGEFSVP